MIKPDDNAKNRESTQSSDPDRVIQRLETMFATHSENTLMCELKTALIELAEEGALNE